MNMKSVAKFCACEENVIERRCCSKKRVAPICLLLCYSDLWAVVCIELCRLVSWWEGEVHWKRGKNCWLKGAFLRNFRIVRESSGRSELDTFSQHFFLHFFTAKEKKIPIVRLEKRDADLPNVFFHELMTPEWVGSLKIMWSAMQKWNKLEEILPSYHLAPFHFKCILPCGFTKSTAFELEPL